MANKFCVSLTHAKDNSDKATVAFVVANAAVGSGKETLVFLSVEAVRLSQKGYADDIREEGFAPLGELMANFAKAGGTMYVCSPCFKKRKLDENNLVAGASIVGGAKLVEFLSDGSPCVSYSSDEKGPSAQVRPPQPPAQRTESTPRGRPSGAASQLDPSHRSGCVSPSGH